MGVELHTFGCKSCGGEFTRRPGDLRSYVAKFGRPPLYCSMQCSNQGRRADTEARYQGTCAHCGGEVVFERSSVSDRWKKSKRYCSVACKGAAKSKMYHAKHPDRRVTRRNYRGYVMLRIPVEGGAAREVLEHRYVMERLLGRKLRPEETVHHKNGQRAHNEPGNLELRSGNHGPGGDVSAMIRWAHDLIESYPQFDREGVFHPVTE